jgi:uncharacterized protein (UPF0335 family)
MTDYKLVVPIVDRIERLEEKQKALLADKRAIYTEAKKANLNPKALRKIIAERRMKDREQIVADMNAYRIALGMAVNDVANGASLREAAAKHGIPKSTLHDAVRREEKSELGQQADDDLAYPKHLDQRPDQPST